VLDGSVLSRVYETPVRVGILRGEEHISVLPPSRRDINQIQEALPAGRPAPAAPAVHVLAGGGSGELLMRALADAGIAFSAGPLNVGDSDHALAARLAALCLAEPPFAAVSVEGLAAARERMLAASAVVVCPMPLGPGNVVLLEGALTAARAGVQVVLLEPEAALHLSVSSPPLADSAAASEDRADALACIVSPRDFSDRAVALYTGLAQAGARLAASPAQVAALIKERLAS
jgi:iron complex transport system ATP-binding protein